MDEDAVRFTRSSPAAEPFPNVVQLPSYRLDCGSTIHVGDTVELMDHTERVAHHPLSGDFLRINAINENLESHEISLTGYRMRRCSYLRPLFDGMCINWECLASLAVLRLHDVSTLTQSLR